jgi:tetratricopeptide (TPR) repeat protein
MIYNDLGDVSYPNGDWDESERFLRAALSEYRKLPEGRYVEMGATLSNLGAVLIKKGKYAEAEPFVREGLELRQKLLGNAYPDTAMSLHRLADLLYKQGNFQEAERAAKESIALFQRAFEWPQEAIYYGAPLTEPGMILNKAGRPREAEDYLRQALRIRTRLLPMGGPLIAGPKYLWANP